MQTYPTSSNRRLRNGLLAAAILAATAYGVRRSARRAERDHPAVGRSIVVDGVRLHYIERGTGEPVLLLHGANVHAMEMLACGLLDELSARYRVIAFDRPGYGYSEAPRDRAWTPRAQALLFEKACAALQVEEPIVVGHSLGAQVALALALDTNLRLRGLVLASGYYFPTLRLEPLYSAPAIPLIGDVLRYTIDPLLAKLAMPLTLHKIFAPRPVDARFMQKVRPLMLRPKQLKAFAQDCAFMVPTAARLARHYGEILLPVEIIAGADDRHISSRWQSSRLHERIPQSKMNWFVGEGHMLHYSRSHAFVDAVDRIATAPLGEALGTRVQPVRERTLGSVQPGSQLGSQPS
jgi:pimeloyl-ACP methyl ester carboxylesterase